MGMNLGPIGNTGPVGKPGQPGCPSHIQRQLFEMIDNIYTLSYTTPHLKITPYGLGEIPSVLDIKYNVKYESNESGEIVLFEFITSEHNGVWGIDRMISVDKIFELIKNEVRDLKIKNILE